MRSELNHQEYVISLNDNKFKSQSIECQAVRTSAIRLQYNYNNITQKFCCIAAVRTSAIQLKYKFFYTTAASSLQVFCKL